MSKSSKFQLIEYLNKAEKRFNEIVAANNTIPLEVSDKLITEFNKSLKKLEKRINRILEKFEATPDQISIMKQQFLGYIFGFGVNSAFPVIEKFITRILSPYNLPGFVPSFIIFGSSLVPPTLLTKTQKQTLTRKSLKIYRKTYKHFQKKINKLLNSISSSHQEELNRIKNDFESLITNLKRDINNNLNPFDDSIRKINSINQLLLGLSPGIGTSSFFPAFKGFLNGMLSPYGITGDTIDLIGTGITFIAGLSIIPFLGKKKEKDEEQC